MRKFDTRFIKHAIRAMKGRPIPRQTWEDSQVHEDYVNWSEDELRDFILSETKDAMLETGWEPNLCDLRPSLRKLICENDTAFEMWVAANEKLEAAAVRETITDADGDYDKIVAINL